MKFSDWELQVLTDAEAPRKCENDTSLYQRGNGTSQSGGAAGVFKYTPTDCRRWRLDTKRRMKEVMPVILTDQLCDQNIDKRFWRWVRRPENSDTRVGDTHSGTHVWHYDAFVSHWSLLPRPPGSPTVRWHRFSNVPQLPPSLQRRKISPSNRMWQIALIFRELDASFICSNLQFFFSKCLHKAPIECGQNAPELVGTAVWEAPHLSVRALSMRCAINFQNWSWREKKTNMCF